MRALVRLCSGFLLAASAIQAPALQRAAARVAGVVYDSVGRGPVAGAHVQLLPLDPAMQLVGRRTTQTDSAGRYAVDSLPAGRYLVGFFHAKLDSLGLDAPVRRIDLRAARSHDVDLAVPSPASVVSAWCGAEAGRDSSGVILGYVRDVGTSATLGDATVAAQWSAITLSAGGARAGLQEARARTNGLGWFGLCGVPRGALLVLRAVTAGDSSALLELDVPDDGVLLRDIALHRGAAAPGGAHPIVRGTVRDRSGEPLAGARVRLWGTAVDARTDDAGEFRFASPVAGTQLVESRMIGFVPVRRVLDVSPDLGARVDLVMTDFPTEIDTVRVLAARPVRHGALAGFERRRRLGHGVFLDTEQIELRRPLVFTDLVRSLPGVEVRNTDLMSRSVGMRGTTGVPCEPALVIDGMHVPLQGGNIDDIIPSDLVRAIEVYPRRIQAPPEYQTPECGSIVVWTGVRGWLAKRLASPRPD